MSSENQKRHALVEKWGGVGLKNFFQVHGIAADSYNRWMSRKYQHQHIVEACEAVAELAERTTSPEPRDLIAILKRELGSYIAIADAYRADNPDEKPIIAQNIGHFPQKACYTPEGIRLLLWAIEKGYVPEN